MIHFCQINYEYLDALGMKLLEGRKFSPEYPADTFNSILLNETVVKEIKFKNPVGSRLLWDAHSLVTAIYGSVVGVVGDFHFTSFHEPIRPFAFLIRNHFFVQDVFTSKLFIKTNTRDLSSTLKNIETLWNEFIPQRPFTYLFMDESFAELHAAESKFKSLFSWLTGLAIFIACLGLLALIAFVVEPTDQRNRYSQSIGRIGVQYHPAVK